MQRLRQRRSDRLADRLDIWGPPLAAGLVAFGHGPWWMPALWGLGLFAARSSETARSAAVGVPLSLALVGALAALPDPLAVTALYVRLALVGLALLFGLERLEQGELSGLGLLALVWLGAPGAAGLLGLVLAGFAFGGFTQRGVRRIGSPQAVWGLAGIAALALASALLLPPAAGRSTARPVPPPLVAQQDTQPARRAHGPAPERQAPSVRRGAPGVRVPDAELPGVLKALQGAAFWPVVFAAALGVAVLAQLGRVRAGPGLSKLHWSELVLLLGAGGALLMLVFSALLRTLGGGTGALAAGAGSSASGSLPTKGGALSTGAQVLLSALGWTGLIGVVLSCLLLAGLTVLVLRARFGEEQEQTEAAFPGAPSPREASQAPLPRIRAAYRSALAALEAAGFVRERQETPQELALRAARHVPALASELGELTALYEPARYGHAPGEDSAERAEAILARLQAALARKTEQRS